MTDLSPAVIKQLAKIDREYRAEHFPEMRRFLIEQAERKIEQGGSNRDISA